MAILKVVVSGDGAIGKVRSLDSAVQRWLDLVGCRRVPCSIQSPGGVPLSGMNQKIAGKKYNLTLAR